MNNTLTVSAIFNIMVEIMAELSKKAVSMSSKPQNINNL